MSDIQNIHFSLNKLELVRGTCWNSAFCGKRPWNHCYWVVGNDHNRKSAWNCKFLILTTDFNIAERMSIYWAYIKLKCIVKVSGKMLENTIFADICLGQPSFMAVQLSSGWRLCWKGCEVETESLGRFLDPAWDFFPIKVFWVASMKNGWQQG